VLVIGAVAGMDVRPLGATALAEPRASR